jgi:hypothetical protein
MNGRGYDYNLGRFLSVDPIIQSPGNSQSLNPYSYIMNNPLAGTDPSGYMGCAASKIESVCDSTLSNYGGNGLGDIKFGLTFTAKSFSGGNGSLLSQGGSGTQSATASAGTSSGSAADLLGQSKNTGIQGSTTSEALSFMWNSFWDNRDEVISGAITGAANSITHQSGGLIEGTVLADISGVNATTDILIAGSHGDLSKVAAGAVGFILGKAKVVEHTVERMSGTHRQLQNAGAVDSHHIIQDAAVKELPGYNRMDAPAVQLRGPSTAQGSEHYLATQVQRQKGGGTYASERRIGYKALRKAGISQSDARGYIKQADNYFLGELGLTPNSVTRNVGNRR